MDYDDSDEVDYEIYPWEYDIAYSHEANEALHAKPGVKDFFTEVQKHTSLADDKTRNWLASLPMKLRGAIPLFEYSEASEDYQLHTTYTSLSVDQLAENPNQQGFGLTIDGKRVELNKSIFPSFVIDLGRLFVNFPRDGDGERVSKWTGYEVFVDFDLALWIVFDTQAIGHPGKDYHLLNPKGLSQLYDESVDKMPQFGVAKLCKSLRNVKSHCLDSHEIITNPNPQGIVNIDRIERSDIAKIDARALTNRWSTVSPRQRGPGEPKKIEDKPNREVLAKHFTDQPPNRTAQKGIIGGSVLSPRRSIQPPR
ncbi:hypothetical protein F4777DRAFT_537550 [Nemania sp. FL0916]|nr:hypothetical protein F4777DRAFT_537550 [Nemania sp. FL0916]